jgi:hypothetical protein
MRRTYKGKVKDHGTFRQCIIMIICITILGVGMSLQVAAAYAREATSSSRVVATCPSSSSVKPGPHSLLVVLLDRSGSLIYQPGATDHLGYSTSVTKALADLWPGQMAVIPFGGDTFPLPVIGPNAMSDPTQRDELKNEVEGNRPKIDADTPLGPAMDQALRLLKGAVSGSKVILITDGMPTGIGSNTGPRQELEIRSHLIPQFCKLGIPISPFGLKIDISTPDGNDADHLLSDIARGTSAGETYTRVQSPEELALQVIGLNAQWQQLSFIQEPRDTDGTYHVYSNDLATNADIITFRSDKRYNVTLLGPNGVPVKGASPTSIDAHYEIYSLDMSSFASGTYKIDAGDDNDAQVYALVDSRLQVKLLVPTPKTAIDLHQPITIEAALYDGQRRYLPTGPAELTADLTFQVKGQADTTITERMKQQGQGIFRIQIPAYERLGQLHIVIHAKYQGVERDTQVFTLQLRLPPPPPCRKGVIQCFWEQHQLQLLIAFPFIAILLLLLMISAMVGSQPKPFGYLHSKANETVGIPLKTLPRFPARLIRRSVIKSVEIRNHPMARKGFPFGAAIFELVFQREHKAYIRTAKSNTIQIRLLVPENQGIAKNQNRSNRGGGSSVLNLEQVGVELKPGELTQLPYGSIIVVRGDPVASFESLPRARARKH